MSKKLDITDVQRRVRNREYMRVKAREFYHRNAARLLEQQRKIKNSRIEMINIYKAECGCIVCGEKDPDVLDLHHRNPKEKYMTISAMINSFRSMVEIWKEIEKCDVLCANCHRRVTAKTRKECGACL